MAVLPAYTSSLWSKSTLMASWFPMYPEGYDVSDAKIFSFWAKASDKNIKAKIGFGLIKQDKPFPDTGIKYKEIVLSTKWKKYKIKTSKIDLSCIRSGLVVFSTSNGFAQDIYIDEVRFE